MTATATVDAIDPEVVALVNAAKEGDNRAFTQLYDRYVNQTYGYIYRRVGDRHLAEDLTGDVFLRAYRRLGTFQWQGVDLGAWIMTIARNRVHDHFKSARTRMEHAAEIDAERHSGDESDSPERVTMARDMARTLGRALERLTADHREVIELRFVHGMSVADTAAVLERTIGATKALQYRALRALSELVKDEPGLSELAAASLAALTVLLAMLTP